MGDKEKKFQGRPVQRAQWISRSVTVAKSFLPHSGQATSGAFVLTTSPGATQFDVFPSASMAGCAGFGTETGG